jgi:hypothetical protein
MSVFAQLEVHLINFAAEHHALLTRNRQGESLRPAGPTMVGFEERRIDWQRAGINRALIIQPDFLVTGVDTSKWNVRLVAWQGSGHHKRTAGQDLVTSMPFQNIADRLADLLAEARSYLNRIQLSDLRPMPYLREQEASDDADE